MSNNPKNIGDALYRYLPITIGLYFLIRLVFTAFVVPHDVPADEFIHIERVDHFSAYTFLPETDLPPEQAALKISPYSPYLYYWLAGKLIHCNIFSISDLIFIRLLSVVFALLTIYFGWKTIRLLSDQRLVHLLFLVLATNTLMFSFTSAAVSYDTMANALASISFYHLCKFLIKRTPISLVYLGLFLGLGCLTKVTMLPFSFALLTCLVIAERKKLVTIRSSFTQWLPTVSNPQRIAIVSLFFIVGLNGFLYGNNLVQFRHLIPRAEQILNEDEILLNPTYARNYILMGYYKGELPLDDALDLAQRIDNKPASSGIYRRLLSDGRKAENGELFTPLSRIEYPLHWYKYMLESTYGILGHKTLIPSKKVLYSFALIHALSLILLIQRYRKKTLSPSEWVMIGSVAIYTLILMQLINYTAHITLQEIKVTISGRYLFQFHIVLCILMAKSLLSTSSSHKQLLYTLLLAGFFIYNDFVFFISHDLF